MASENKTILITGGNKGIGKEIARQLGVLGHFIILTARDAQKGEQAFQELQNQGIKGEFIQLDITSKESRQQAFEKFQSFGRSLDVLVNNAAILYKNDSKILEEPEEIIEKTLQNNSLAHLYMTRQFAPLLVRGSRIIMISSGAGSMSESVNGWAPAYSISKTTLNGITRQLAHAFAQKGVAVNAMGPGWVRTDMGGKAAPRSVEQGAETAVWLATEASIELTGKFFRDKNEVAW